MQKHTFIALFAALILSGCAASGPDVRADAPAAPEAVQTAEAAAGAPAPEAAKETEAEQERSFADLMRRMAYVTLRSGGELLVNVLAH